VWLQIAEKNPGLFLQAAFEVLRQRPLTRFVMVGDGELRQSLQQLARRLKISHAGNESCFVYNMLVRS